MKKFCNFYIGLWCLYELQGTLYESGSLLSRALLFILLAVSLYYFVYSINHYNLPSVLKVLAVLVGIWTVYGGFNIIFGNGVDWVNDFDYLKLIYMSLLPIFAFYVFAKKGALTENSLRIWTLIFIPVAAACFSYNYSLQLQATLSYESWRDEFTNSGAYLFLSILPLIPLFYKKSLVQYILLGVCMFYILMGMKRGAILIGVVAVSWFLYTSLFSGGRQNRKKVLRSIFTIIIIIGMVYAVQYLISNSYYFNVRVTQTLEGNSSRRDVLYSFFYNYLLNEASLLELIIGSGADGTLRLFDQYAHNDWLEIGINNGIIVAFLFGVFVYRLFRVSRQSRSNLLIHQVLGLFFIIVFLKTFFSMSYNDVSIYSSSVFSFALVMLEFERKKEITKV